MLDIARFNARARRRAVKGLIATAAATGGLTLAPASVAALALPDIVGPVLGPVCGATQTVAGATEGAPLVGPAVETGSDLACSLSAAQFTWVTVYDPPGPATPVRTEHTGIVTVPSPLDVNGDTLPDLLATATVLPTGGAQMDIDRFPGATGALPLSVEAVLSIPQSGSRKAAVGYDALASDAPQSFTADFNFQGDTTSVTLTQSGAGSPMALTGELFTPSGTARTNPQKVRIGFAPMPATTTASVTADDGASHVTLTSSAASLVDVDAEDRTGARAVVLDAQIDRLPTSLDVDIVDGGSGRKELHYDASAPIDRIDATLREVDGSALLQEAVLHVEDLPTQVDITQPGPESVELTANNPIGVVQGGFARGGGVRLLDPVNNPAYAYIVDDGTVSSKALRALGVSHAKAVMTGNLSLEADLQSSPFTVKLEDGARTIDGRVLNLPSSIDLVYSPANGTVDYTGNAPIGEVRVTANDPAGLLGRATRVELLAQGLPTQLSLGFGQTAQGVSVDAHGSHIGRIELLATNGPTPTLLSTRDGIQLRDQGAPYLLFGRLTGLRKATAVLAPDPDLFVDTTGGRVFEADLSTEPNTFMRAVLDSLQPNTHIRVLPHGTEGSKVTYGAAGPSSSLFFTSNGDDESDFMEAKIAPVPASLSLCSSKDMSCNNSGGSAANAGAVRFDASQPTLINMFQCTRPLTGCTSANATEFTRITNLTAQTVGLDANVSSTGLSGRVFLDTDNRALHGSILMKLGNPIADRVTINLPTGFRAENRLARWPGDPTQICSFGVCIPGPPAPVTRSGTITCPPSTAFDIRLLSLIDVDVDFLLC